MKIEFIYSLFCFKIQVILEKLISATDGRFPRARLQPIEQRRVQFVIISVPFAEILQPLLPTLGFGSQKPFFGNGFRLRSVQGLQLALFPLEPPPSALINGVSYKMNEVMDMMTKNQINDRQQLEMLTIE